MFLQDIPRQLDSHRHRSTCRLGEIFGELAALSRTPRTATVLADGAVTLLEIRWQGLRDLMRRTPAIREHVERLYRENSLLVHLRETPLFAELSGWDLERIAAATVFESYGNFDWYTDFGAQRSGDAASRIAAEPLIASEGQIPTGLSARAIRLRPRQPSPRPRRANDRLPRQGPGIRLGRTRRRHMQTGEDVPLRHSLRAVGYVDILRIPSEVVFEVILQIASTADKRRQHRRPSRSDQSLAIQTPTQRSNHRRSTHARSTSSPTIAFSTARRRC